MLPKFIIIGTMKGGTTSLYHYIASHPDTEPSSIKETNYFRSTDDFSRGLCWYKPLWVNNAKYAFEASPDYTKRHLWPGVPERMWSVLPDIKLIYVVRDPIERMISHYIQNYAHGRESRIFSEVLRNMGENYVQTSKYYFQLQAYLEYYSEDQLLIVESEKLRKEPACVLNEVFKFIGLSSVYDERVLTKSFNLSNEKKRKSYAERWVRRKTNNPFLLYLTRKVGKHFRKPIERPVLTSAEKERLSEELAPDVDKLRQFSGKKFSDWSV